MSNIEQLVKSGGKLPEILGAVVPVAKHTPSTEFDVAVPVRITPKVQTAVERIFADVVQHEVVEVTERRALTQTEIDALSDEREALDQIEKYIKARKEAHRAMVFNHFDIEIEGSLPKAEIAKIELDDKRHYLAPQEVHTSDGEKRFTREIRGGKPTLLAERLQELADSDDFDGFDHEDYLACTSAVRVLDEEKALLHLRKKPGIVAAWAAAAEPGKTTASFYRR